MVVLGMESGLRTIVASCNPDSISSFKLVFVEAIAEGEGEGEEGPERPTNQTTSPPPRKRKNQVLEVSN